MEKIAKTRYMKWLDEPIGKSNHEFERRKKLIIEKRYGNGIKAGNMQNLDLGFGEDRRKFKKAIGAGKTPMRAAIAAQGKRDLKVTDMKVDKYIKAENEAKQKAISRANNLKETLSKAHAPAHERMRKAARNKKIALGVGIGTAVGAGAYGAKKLYDKYQQKTAFDTINDSFEKIAKTKAQKMINGGRLAYDNAQKLFQKVPASNNINNRINAKAKRMLGGVVPKNMSAKSYKKVSKIDSLGSSAPINTNRLLKHQGHENSKIVRELNRQTGGNAKVSRTKNLPLDGGSRMSWEIETAKPLEWGINIPKKNAKDSAISNAANREIRGLTARHEIAGEATSQSRTLKALKKKGYNATNSNVDSMRINNHQNPDVLVGDAKFVRQLSPASKKRFAEKNADNVTGISNRSYMGGRKMDEGELMNTLRMPGSRISTNGSDNGKILTNYFERKIPKKAERKTMMENMAAINGFNSQEARSAVSGVVDEYQRTPFSTYKGRKKR